MNAPNQGRDRMRHSSRMRFIYWLPWKLCRLVYAVYFRWSVRGAERIPGTGPLILAANHSSFLDPPLVGASIRREVCYLARDTLFRLGPLGWFLREVNAVPVDREGGGAAGLRAIHSRLENHNAILLFPEGTRSPDGRLQSARPGIGLVVIKSGAPVVPVRLSGTFEAWPRDRRWPRPVRLSVHWGEPMFFARLRTEAQHCSRARLKEIYQQVADEIMDRIVGLPPADSKRSAD